MRRGRYRMIGVIMLEKQGFPDIPAHVITGAAEIFSQNGLKMVIMRVPGNLLDPDKINPGLFAEYMVDGFLVGGWRGMMPKEQSLIEESKYPIVWMNFKAEKNCVHFDDKAAGRMATQHLIAHGHRRIAFLNFSGSGGHYSKKDRLAGYLQVMKNKRLEPIDMASHNYNIPRNMRLAKTKEILSNDDRPTGIVTYGQSTVLPLLFGATSLIGFKIPDELSVITFEDKVEDNAGIEVSTVLLPERELGVEAAKMLLQRISSDGEPLKSVRIPPLAIRGTTVSNPPASTVKLN